MSFNLPRNVPRFDDAQRQYENALWSYARGGGGPGAQRGGLPMYKDKPVGWAPAARPFWQRKRYLAIAAVASLCLFLTWMWSGSEHNGAQLASGGSTSAKDQAGSRSWTRWFSPRSRKDDIWLQRRDEVKSVFVKSWENYERIAWGNDEVFPISHTSRMLAPGGLGFIIVDALDSLMLFNLTSHLTRARAWINTSLNFAQDVEVNASELNSRVLGGLLSAHYLSTSHPQLAPLVEDDQGKPGEDLYLEKAMDLADRVLGAFDTESRVPYARVNLASRIGVPAPENHGATKTADVASMLLELKYLSSFVGEHVFWEAADKASHVLAGLASDGLLPELVNPDNGQAAGAAVGGGRQGLEPYEMWLKQYLQSSKEEPIYKELWQESSNGIQQHLIGHSQKAGLTVIGSRRSGLKEPLSPEMQLGACSLASSIALAATDGRSIARLRKEKQWRLPEGQQVTLAQNILDTCWAMYLFSPSQVAPDALSFDIKSDGATTKAKAKQQRRVDLTQSQWESDVKWIPSSTAHSGSGPMLESLLTLYRVTGDVEYRERGWALFQALRNQSQVPDSDSASFAHIANVTSNPAQLQDRIDPDWLSRTLKYLYLLFSPPELLPLDQIVWSPSGHPLPRFQLTKGLKTGWTRDSKPAQKVLAQNGQTDSGT